MANRNRFDTDGIDLDSLTEQEIEEMFGEGYEDDLVDDDDDAGLSNEDLGLCPHCGARDDDGCDSDCPSYLGEDIEDEDSFEW